MDYLLKNHIDARTLDRVLQGALQRNTLKGLADLLRDPLTGLYIRDGFLRQFPMGPCGRTNGGALLGGKGSTHVCGVPG